MYFFVIISFLLGELLFHILKLFLCLISSIPYGITGIPFPHIAPKDPTVSNKENEETPNAIEGLSEIFDIIPSFFACFIMLPLPIFSANLTAATFEDIAKAL